VIFSGGRPAVILCPYCLHPVEEDAKTCSSCGRDVTGDALVEMTLEDFAAAERKSCPVCGTSLLALAIVCPVCGSSQRGAPPVQ
jgi:DNA-directed RNA polymerase subunit RPC12/RpoP